MKLFSFKAHLIVMFITVCTLNSFSLTPPDAPITPAEFSKKMGSGSWMIFDVDGGENNSRIGYNSQIPAIMKANGSNGGRLHINLAKGSYDVALEFPTLYPEAVTDVNNMIDGFIAEGMYVVIHVATIDAKNLFDDVDPNSASYKFAMNQHITIWTQLCNIIKDKSHKLAICPVIEFHGWRDFKSSNRPALDTGFNDFLQQSFDVFRASNPTRIISYKGYAASRINRDPWDALNIPFGDATDYYMVNGSGATVDQFEKWIEYGKPSAAYTLAEMKQQVDDYYAPAVVYSQANTYSSGGDMIVMVDHWDTEHDQGYPEDGYLSSVGIDVTTVLDGTASSQILKKYNHLIKYNDQLANDGISWTDPRSYSLKQREAFGRYFTNTMEKLGWCGAVNAHIMSNYWEEGATPGSGTSLYPAVVGSLKEKHQEVGQTLHCMRKFTKVVQNGAEATYREVVTDELAITGWESSFEVLDKPQDPVLYQVNVTTQGLAMEDVEIEAFEHSLITPTSPLVSCYAKSSVASAFKFKIIATDVSNATFTFVSPEISIDNTFSEYSFDFVGLPINTSTVKVSIISGKDVATYDYGLLKVQEGNNTLGIENLLSEDSNIAVYAHDKDVYVKFSKSERNVSVKIYNVIGKLLKTDTYMNIDKQVINTSFAKGIYLVEVATESEKIIKKVIL